MPVFANISGYTHTQSSASTQWDITHNLGRKIVVDVFVDVGGTLTKILPLEVQLIDDNTTRVLFSSARTGIARVA